MRVWCLEFVLAVLLAGNESTGFVLTTSVVRGSRIDEFCPLTHIQAIGAVFGRTFTSEGTFLEKWTPKAYA